MTDLSTVHRVELGLQTRLAPIGSVNAEARTAELIWTTGAPVRRWSWQRGAEYWEELSLDPAHVRMDRLRNGAPLLNTHNAFELGAVLGVVERADLASGRGSATVRFSDREEVEPIFRDVRNKIVRNVSCGYVVHRMLETGETREGLPVYRAIDWEPMELSLVPIGADSGAQVRAESSGTRYPCEILTRGNQAMETTALPAPQTPEDHPAVLAERARAARIHAYVREHPLLTAEDQREWIESGLPWEQVRVQGLEKLVARQVPTRRSDPYIDMGLDYASPVAQRELMVAALDAKIRGVQLEGPARQFASLSLVDLARARLESSGVSTRGMRPNQILTRTSQSNSDFPAIVADAANKSLLAFYGGMASGLKGIARKTTIDDFKKRNLLRLSQASALETVLPSGEIKSGFFTDSNVSYGLTTWAKIYGINRQTLVNDDTGAFEQIARAAAIAAYEVEAAQLALLLTSNPTMYDTVACFHANHGNLAASGGAIAIDTLGAGLSAMRLQTGLGGSTPLGIAPKYLICSAAKETVARQYVAQLTPNSAASVNPFAQVLEVIPEPRLDASSATAWYIAHDGTIVPTLEYAYLTDEQGPQIVTRTGFEVEGMELKVRLDFGCVIVDWRGLYKNPGA